MRARTRPCLVNFVRDVNEKGLVEATICHAAQLLVEADVMRGKTLTCVRSVSTGVKNAGGNYVNEPVVVDSNLVTRRFPPDMPARLPAILKQLEG